MTQKQMTLHLLKTHPKVTLRMAFDAGIGYTFRNRISELRQEGYDIRQMNGDRPSDNYYELVSEPGLKTQFYKGQGYLVDLL